MQTSAMSTFNVFVFSALTFLVEVWFLFIIFSVPELGCDNNGIFD